MASENEFMLEIAAAVADGTAVDWARAEAHDQDEHDRRVLRSLRLLAKIGTVHDSVDDEPTARRPGTAPRWRRFRRRPGDRRDQRVAAHWGRYELREELGAGAQGAVYRAWDPQLECEVALKVLQPRLAAADRVGDRMLREGRALAASAITTSSTSTAPSAHEGQVGLCMEFIRGQTLEDILTAQGPFGAGEAVTVGSESAARSPRCTPPASSIATSRRRNVMREDGGRIVLMDFGTGRDRRTAGAGRRRRARRHAALHGARSPRRRRRPRLQSDIYSVGVLLYYLSPGSFPSKAARSTRSSRPTSAAGASRSPNAAPICGTTSCG